MPSLLHNISKWRFYTILVIIILVAIALFVLYRSCKGDSIGIFVDNEKETSLTQITEIKEIGQWEFLSVEDEEMVDTTRTGIFSDDYLVRIYYGTLRLGLDLSNLKDSWINVEEGKISVLLPAITLLDNRFVDEARTQSFYESGSWNDQTRADMYERAYKKMLHRCFTAENIKCAEENARRQFYRMLKSLGYDEIEIKFDNVES